jgi:hypothetical protein
MTKENDCINQYLIHSCRTWKGSTKPKSMVLHGVPRPCSSVKHVLDCLSEIKKLNSQPIVLVMAYASSLKH